MRKLFSLCFALLVLAPVCAAQQNPPKAVKFTSTLLTENKKRVVLIAIPELPRLLARAQPLSSIQDLKRCLTHNCLGLVAGVKSMELREMENKWYVAIVPDETVLER